MPFFLKPCMKLRKKKRRGKISKTIKQIADVTCEVTNTEILHDCMSSSSNIINVRNNVSNNNNEATRPHSSHEREEPTMNEPTNSGAQKVCRRISISGYDADKPIDTRIDSDLVVIKAEDAKFELECEIATEKDEESASNHGSDNDRGSEDDGELMDEVASLLSSLCDLAAASSEDSESTTGGNEDCSLIPYSDNYEKLEIDADLANEIRRASFTIEIESLSPSDLIDNRSSKAIEIIKTITVCSDVFQKIEELKALEFFDIQEPESAVEIVEDVKTEVKCIADSFNVNENEEPEIAVKSASEGENIKRKDDTSDLGTDTDLKEYFSNAESQHGDYKKENELANSKKKHDEKNEKDLETENEPKVVLKEYFNNAESEHGDYEKENQDRNSLECGKSHDEQKEKGIGDLTNENYVHKRIICDLQNGNETKNRKEILCDSIFEKENKDITLPTCGIGDTKQSIENGEQNSYFSKLKNSIRNYDLEITEVKEYVNNERQTSDSCNINKNETNSSKETLNSVNQGSVGEGGDIKNYTIFTESSKMDCNIFNNSQHTDNAGISIETVNIQESHEEVKDIIFSEDCVTDQHENDEEDSINVKSARDVSKEISDVEADSEFCTVNEFDHTSMSNENKSNTCEDVNNIKSLIHHDEMIINDKEYSEQSLLKEYFDSENEDDADLQNQNHSVDSVVAEEVCSSINDQININSNNNFINYCNHNVNSNETETKEFSIMQESHVLEGISQDTESKLDVNQENKTISIIKDLSNIACTSGSNQELLEITLNSTSNAEYSNCENELHFNLKEKKKPSNSEKSMDLLNFKLENEMPPGEKHSLGIESLLSLPIISTENKDFAFCCAKEELEKVDSSNRSISLQTGPAYVNSEIDEIKPGDNASTNGTIPNGDRDFSLDCEIRLFNNDTPVDAMETFDLTIQNDFSFNIEELFQKQFLEENSVSMHVLNPTNKKSKSNEDIQSEIGDSLLLNAIDNDISSTHEFPMQTSSIKLLSMGNINHLPLKDSPAYHKNCKEDPFFNDYMNNKDSDSNDSEDSDDNDSDDSHDSDSDDGEVKDSVVNEVKDYNYNKWFENMKHDTNGNANFNDTDHSKILDQTDVCSFQSNLDSFFLGNNSSKNRNCGRFNNNLTEKNSFAELHSVCSKLKMNDYKNNSNARNFMETVSEESCSVDNNSDNAEISHPFNIRMDNRSLQRIAPKPLNDSPWKSSTSFNFTKKPEKSINKYCVSSPSDSSDSSDKSENGEPNEYLRSKGSKCFVVSACGDNKNFDALEPTQAKSYETSTGNSKTAECLKTPPIARNAKNTNASKKLSGSEIAVENKCRIHITNKTSPKRDEKMAKTNNILNNTKSPLISNKKFSDFLKNGQFEKLPFPTQPHKYDNKNQDNCHSILSKIENIFTEIEKKSKLHDFDEIEVCRRQFINKFLSKKKKILSEMRLNIRDVPIKNGFNLQSQFCSSSKNATGKGKNGGKSQLAHKTRESENRINDFYKPSQYRNDKPRGKMNATSPKIHSTKCQIERSNNNKISSDTDSEILTDQSAKMTPDRKRILDASRDIRSPKLPFKVNKKSLHHATLHRGRSVILRPSKMNLVVFLTKDGDDSYQIKRGYRLHNPDTRKSRTVATNPDNQDSSRSRNYRCLTSRATSPDELKLKFDDLFRKYASRGRPNGELISSKRSTEWLKDAGVIGKKITMEEANDAFKCIAGVKVALNKGDYRHFLQKFTRLKRLNYFEIYERLCSAANKRQD